MLDQAVVWKHPLALWLFSEIGGPGCLEESGGQILGFGPGQGILSLVAEFIIIKQCTL